MDITADTVSTKVVDSSVQSCTTGSRKRKRRVFTTTNASVDFTADTISATVVSSSGQSQCTKACSHYWRVYQLTTSTSRLDSQCASTRTKTGNEVNGISILDHQWKMVSVCS